jgi:outer membrane protein OmpA-like peptidoglycan-associated protein
MAHEIPGFGSARLARNAGSAEVLEIKGRVQNFDKGAVRIEAVPPVWRSEAPSGDLGQVQANGQSLEIRGAQIATITGSLEQGMNVMFSGANLRVGLEAHNFSKAFATYKICVKNLIPYNFNQISRTQLVYHKESDDLSPAAKTQLDKIVRYVKADSRVLGIIIDAHSDKQATPEDGVALSQRQAEFVTRYLVDQGLPADNITMRWHGDKFPIANNGTKAGQARNRRVTVRLENAETRKQMEKKIAAIKEAEQKAAAEKAIKEAKAEEKTQDPATIIDPAELQRLTEEQELPTGAQPGTKNKSE